MTSTDVLYLAVGSIVTVASIVGLSLRGKAPPKGDKLR